MYIRGGSEHQTKSSISLMPISSAIPTISSAAKFKKAYKCFINHHFVFGKGSPSFFFRLSFAVVPRGEFDNLLLCTHPIKNTGCTYMIYNKKSHARLISYCCITAVSILQRTKGEKILLCLQR